MLSKLIRQEDPDIVAELVAVDKLANQIEELFPQIVLFTHDATPETVFRICNAVADARRVRRTDFSLLLTDNQRGVTYEEYVFEKDRVVEEDRVVGNAFALYRKIVDKYEIVGHETALEHFEKLCASENKMAQRWLDAVIQWGARFRIAREKSEKTNSASESLGVDTNIGHKSGSEASKKVQISGSIQGAATSSQHDKAVKIATSIDHPSSQAPTSTTLYTSMNKPSTKPPPVPPRAAAKIDTSRNTRNPTMAQPEFEVSSKQAVLILHARIDALEKEAAVKDTLLEKYQRELEAERKGKQTIIDFARGLEEDRAKDKKVFFEMLDEKNRLLSRAVEDHTSDMNKMENLDARQEVQIEALLDELKAAKTKLATVDDLRTELQKTKAKLASIEHIEVAYSILLDHQTSTESDTTATVIEDGGVMHGLNKEQEEKITRLTAALKAGDKAMGKKTREMSALRIELRKRGNTLNFWDATAEQFIEQFGQDADTEGAEQIDRLKSTMARLT